MNIPVSSVIESCDWRQEQSLWNVDRIVFDFGGVLIKPNEEQVADYLAHVFGVSADEIQKYDCRVNGQEMRKLQWIGVDEQEYAMWVAYADELGKTFAEPEKWREEYQLVKEAALQTLPGIVELLRDLKMQNYHLDLLSNFPEWMQPYLDKLLADLRQSLGCEPFDVVHLSYQTHQQKPNPEAFLGILRSPPERTVFIDDQRKNILSAEACGFHTIHFVSVAKVREEFMKRGVL